MPRITIGIDEVAIYGSIPKAIIAHCENTYHMASASHCDHTGNAIAAFNDGQAIYVSPDDGTYIEAQNPSADSAPEEIRVALNGEKYVITEWSDESCVYLCCPTLCQCLDAPEAATELILAAESGTHKKYYCDVDAWRVLAYKLRDAAQMLAPLIAPVSGRKVNV